MTHEHEWKYSISFGSHGGEPYFWEYWRCGCGVENRQLTQGDRVVGTGSSWPD